MVNTERMEEEKRGRERRGDYELSPLLPLSSSALSFQPRFT
jgi:hypothetical protein